MNPRLVGNQNALKHGYTRRNNKHKLYSTWESMLKRCRDSNHISYKYYGGKGITVCDRWNTFTGFLADVGEPPTPDHELARLDHAGDYEPGNVAWMSKQDHETFDTTRGRDV